MADIDESYEAYLQSLQDPGTFMLGAVAGPEDGGGDEEEEDEDETEDDRDGVEYIGSQTVDVADDDEDATASAQARLGEEEEPRDERLGEGGGGGGEACSPGRFGADGADSEASQSKRGEIDGLFCPICMEAWTDDGDHQMWSVFYVLTLSSLS